MFVNKPLLQHAYNGPFVLVDRGLLEYVGPTGFSAVLRRISFVLSSTQSGRAYDYAGAFLSALYIVSLVCSAINASTLFTI